MRSCYVVLFACLYIGGLCIGGLLMGLGDCIEIVMWCQSRTMTVYYSGI